MKKNKMIFVGWDGADWNIARPLMKAGKLPQLTEIVKNGVSGPIESLPPYLSPMLWNIIGTGKHPAEHGIVGFTEYNPKTNKVQPMSSRSRKVKALWNMLSQSGLKSHVFGWFASHPAEKISGVYVSETFAKFQAGGELKAAPAGSVYPEALAEELSELRVAPSEVDVQILRFFIPKIDEIDLRRDTRPDKLMLRLSELYTLHNAAVATLQKDPDTDFLAIYYHFIDWVCHDFMEYGAPQRPGISNRDFELYSKVIEQAYILQDLLLRDLLSHTAPHTQCALVSDHGFLSGEDRPLKTPSVTAGIAAWHRPQGLFAIAGPGIEKDTQIDGAQLFDVTPTVLHAYGLPIGQDMRGRVLIEAFTDQNRPIRQIESWDQYGPPLEECHTTEMGAKESADLLKQFEDLGYIDLKGDPFETAETLTRRENAWNLGQSLLNEQRPAEALPYLEEAYFYNPEQPYIALPLARCEAQLGLIEESQRTAQTLLDYDIGNAEVSLLLAELSRLWRDYESALDYVEKALKHGASRVKVSQTKGLIFLHQERFNEAETTFRDLYENTSEANHLLGWCRALTQGGKEKEAEPLIRSFLNDHPGSANGWFTLGQVLVAEDQLEAASDAFKKATLLQPNFLNAQINLTRQEKAILEQQGHFLPFEAPNFDFSKPETREQKWQKENSERLTALRQGSHIRRDLWLKTRDIERQKIKPLDVIQPIQAEPAPSDQEPITIVTGLPRSGTSLMMQMLQRSGMLPKTDTERPPDKHNPRGYFEWEAIKTLKENPTIIDEAAGKVVKVVSIQLAALPRGRRYRLIWMDRPVEEIAKSQGKMILADHPDRELSPLEERIAQLKQHRKECLDLFRGTAQDDSKELKLIEIKYHNCLNEISLVREQISEFLSDQSIDTHKMQDAVDKALWHEK